MPAMHVELDELLRKYKPYLLPSEVETHFRHDASGRLHGSIEEKQTLLQLRVPIFKDNVYLLKEEDYRRKTGVSSKYLEYTVVGLIALLVFIVIIQAAKEKASGGILLIYGLGGAIASVISLFWTHSCKKEQKNNIVALCVSLITGVTGLHFLRKK